MKKKRSIYLSDYEWKKFNQKVEQYFSGRGKIERYLEKLINAKSVVFIETDGEVNLILK